MKPEHAYVVLNADMPQNLDKVRYDFNVEAVQSLMRFFAKVTYEDEKREPTQGFKVVSRNGKLVQ